MNYTELSELEQWLKKKKFKGFLSIQDKEGVYGWNRETQSLFQIGENTMGEEEDNE